MVGADALLIPGIVLIAVGVTPPGGTTAPVRAIKLSTALKASGKNGR